MLNNIGLDYLKECKNTRESSYFLELTHPLAE